MIEMPVIIQGPAIAPPNRIDAQIGEVRYISGAIEVFDGSQWQTINQTAHFAEMSDYDMVSIRRFIDNQDKYEEILKEHFPEDYL